MKGLVRQCGYLWMVGGQWRCRALGAGKSVQIGRPAARLWRLTAAKGAPG